MSVNENPQVPVKRIRMDESCTDWGEPQTEDTVAEDEEKDTNGEWVAKLQQLLFCPVCYETIRPPVDICSNGHSVCLKCRSRLYQCPVCNAEFVKATNFMLAQIADYVKYPCPNAIGGCKEVYHLREEEAHLTICAYTVHRCKIDNCEWLGKLDELRAHVEGCHTDGIWVKDWCFSGSRKFEEDETLSDEFGKLLIIQDELFWMLSSYNSEKKKLFKTFQYIGTKEAANSFVYQICLKSFDDKQQFLFKSVMDNDSKSGSDVFDSPNCTVIDFSVLRMFSASSPDIKLKYHYFISKRS